MKKIEKLKIKEYFSEVKTNETYKPYFYSMEDAIIIVIVGTFCGFRNLKQIHQWASHEKIEEMLSEYFGVTHVHCYYWLTWLLKILNPQSANECFTRWVESLLPENMEGYTISFNGKTICSTCNEDWVNLCCIGAITPSLQQKITHLMSGIIISPATH